MPRISVPAGSITSDTVVLPEAEAKRLAKVLRMGAGDSLTLFDGATEYDCRISSITSKSVTLQILGSKEAASEPPVSVTLGQGMPKGDKLELVVQKAVELGASRIVPVVLERSVKRPDVSGKDRKAERLARIATEAAQQSGRVRVPEVEGQTGLDGFLKMTEGAELKVVLYEGERSKGIRDILAGARGVKEVAVLVGPEGGLTEDEVAMCVSRGFVVAGLGPRILRTETAGIAVLTVIQYELGDLG